MIRCTSYIVLILALVTFTTARLCPARADDAEAVKEKLFQAKKEYDSEVQKFKQSVQEVFDKREELARAAGDKKAVDQVKAEREAFTKTGEPPATLSAAVKQRATMARVKLEKAYTATVKDYLRMKEDAAADVADKERQEFLLSSAFLVGKRTYLTTLKHSDLKVQNGDSFTNDGTQGRTKIKLKMNGEFVPHSIFLHAPTKGSAQVSYALGGKWTAFRANIGVPKIDAVGDPASPLTFELLGDGKSLWKSAPVTMLDTFQTCEVNIEKVKSLTLSVHCPNSGDGARSVWFEPILVE